MTRLESLRKEKLYFPTKSCTFLAINTNTPRVRLYSMLENMSRGNLYVSRFQVHYRAQCV
jgi:hypothetical protein